MEWLTKKKEWKIIDRSSRKKRIPLLLKKRIENFIFSLNWNEILNFFDYPTRKSDSKDLYLDKACKTK